MVWIHGGGLAVGSNSELVYTGKELVRRSMKAGMPVIYVAINYRLGPFGFLSSKQLLEENGGKAVGNYGLWDQRLALQFVSDHISAFGGDPNRVTVFGESAGGGWFLPLNKSQALNNSQHPYMPILSPPRLFSAKQFANLVLFAALAPSHLATLTWTAFTTLSLPSLEKPLQLPQKLFARSQPEISSTPPSIWPAGTYQSALSPTIALCQKVFFHPTPISSHLHHGCRDS